MTPYMAGRAGPTPCLPATILATEHGWRWRMCSRRQPA